MACPICREEHGSDRELSFDGVGINSCGMYRARLASFMGDTGKASRPVLGPLFAAAPWMLTALESAERVLARYDAEGANNIELAIVRHAIAKAKGER